MLLPAEQGDIRLASTSSSGPFAGAWSPQSEAERASVLEHLDRVLSSPVFRSSKRYPALLKFIVEQTLDDRGAGLKERVLGIEVFGRAPDYDTNSDHVVRTAAGEVRKRLAQYYMEAGRDDEIRIEVPPGSYVAQFRLSSESLSARQLEALAIPPPIAEVPLQRSWWARSRTKLTASLALNAVLVLALVYAGRSALGPASTLEKFWNPVFASSSPILICVGLRDGRPVAPTGQAPQIQTATDTTDPLLHRVSMAELLALSRVTSYAGERHARYRILDPVSTSFSDLQNQPTVLIGVGNNDWTKQIAGQLRYSFLLGDRGPTAVLDRQKPGVVNWRRASDATGDTKDYAIVSRLVDPRVEQEVVIIGGIGPHGTQAAGEFVTNPDQIRKLEAYAPSGWGQKNLQVVLSTEVVKGSSGPPKIEAAYFW